MSQIQAMAARTSALMRPRPMLKPRSLSQSLPAPVGGWNARDSLGDMPKTDAVSLENWFPRTTSVDLRAGYIQSATGLGNQVETLMSYNGSTTQKLFGITNAGSIFDCTSTGAVGAAAVSGLTNGRWQYVNIATPGG